MFTLYVRSGCPYSAIALAALEETQAPVTVKNIADPVALTELLELGGHEQVPFLVSDDNEVNMYESEKIAAYLREHFGSTAAA